MDCKAKLFELLTKSTRFLYLKFDEKFWQLMLFNCITCVSIVRPQQWRALLKYLECLITVWLFPDRLLVLITYFINFLKLILFQKIGKILHSAVLRAPRVHWVRCTVYSAQCTVYIAQWVVGSAWRHIWYY